MFFADGQRYDPTSFTINSFRFSNERLIESGFSEQDHFDPEFNLGYRGVLMGPVAKSISGHNFYSQANALQRLFFHRCFSDYGTPYVRSFLANRNNNEVSGGFLTYNDRFNPFHGKSERRLNTTLAHLRRAVEIRSKLNFAHRTTRALGNQLDAVKSCVFVIDTTRRVLYQNQSAEILLRDGKAVALSAGALRAKDRAADQQIARRLAQLSDPTDDTVEGPIQLSKDPEGPAYLAWVYPATGFATSGLPNSAHACILIRDPFATTSLADRDILMAQFELTLAEARVAQLTTLALTRQQMAERLGLSENTVKTHLSQARAKTGAQSTTELALKVAKFQHG